MVNSGQVMQPISIKPKADAKIDRTLSMRKHHQNKTCMIKCMCNCIMLPSSPKHIEKSWGITVTKRQRDTKGTININNHYVHGSQLGSTIRVGSKKRKREKKESEQKKVKKEKPKITNGLFGRAKINYEKKSFLVILSDFRKKCISCAFN